MTVRSDVRVLVTGAEGMLGSSFVQSLRRLHPDDEIVGVGRADADLQHRAAVDLLIDEVAPDAIVHAAARVGGIAAKVADPMPYLLDNVRIDGNVISASLDAGIPELLYIGSAAIYPEAAEQPIAEEAILSGRLESANESYALAKIVGARLCAYASATRGVAYRSAVPSNLYGPGDADAPNRAHLIASILSKTRAAQHSGADVVPIWGSGRARREFTFAPDLTDWLSTQIGALSDWPELLNVGVGIDHTVTEYYEMAAAVIGFEGRFEYEPNRPEGAARRLLDSSRARVLGWDPQTTLAEGMTLCLAELDAGHDQKETP